MKRPPKRYQNREEIISAINMAQQDIRLCQIHVETMQRRIDDFHKWQSKNPEPKPVTDFWRGQFHEKRRDCGQSQDNIDKANRKSGRLNRKLEDLKEKLATMDTMTMPFLTDVSIT